MTTLAWVLLVLLVYIHLTGCYITYKLLYEYYKREIENLSKHGFLHRSSDIEIKMKSRSTLNMVKLFAGIWELLPILICISILLEWINKKRS